MRAQERAKRKSGAARKAGATRNTERPGAGKRAVSPATVV
jgi:hypothetical protein